MQTSGKSVVTWVEWKIVWILTVGRGRERTKMRKTFGTRALIPRASTYHFKHEMIYCFVVNAVAPQEKLDAPPCRSVSSSALAYAASTNQNLFRTHDAKVCNQTQVGPCYAKRTGRSTTMHWIGMTCTSYKNDNSALWEGRIPPLLHCCWSCIFDVEAPFANWDVLTSFARSDNLKTDLRLYTGLS